MKNIFCRHPIVGDCPWAQTAVPARPHSGNETSHIRKVCNAANPFFKRVKSVCQRHSETKAPLESHDHHVIQN